MWDVIQRVKYLCYTWGIPVKLMVLAGIKDHFAAGATILKMERGHHSEVHRRKSGATIFLKLLAGK